MADYPICCGRAAFKRAKLSYTENPDTTKIEPNRDLVAGARAFNRTRGLEDPHEGIDYHKVMTHKGLITDLGREYDKLPDFDHRAVPHFQAMRDEIGHQFHHMTHNMGIQTQVVDHDPYKDVHELARDVRDNHRIQVLGTHVTGGHPFFSNRENDQFRAVHDVFGHLAAGRGFDRHGEEAAYQAHSRMFSHHARPAMASETRGQNGSLVSNNGRFGPQKIALLPHRLWHPGLARGATFVVTSHIADEYRVEREAQDRRFEGWARGGISANDRHTPEYQEYFGTGEHAGSPHAQERRHTFKNWLIDRKAPEEVRAPHEEENHRGFEMGQRHGEDPANADFEEMERHHMESPHPDHFYKGYLEGFRGMSHTWDKTASERIAILVSDSPFKIVAHVSGNQIDILHCPFCGSGAIIGRSDGTVECGFCTSVYTVQVQPQYNGMPQSVDGQPYQWPGMPEAPGEPIDPMDPNAEPMDPTAGAGLAEPDMPEGTNLNPNTNGGGGFQSSDPADGGFGEEGEEGEEGDDDDKPDFLKGKGDSKSKSKGDDKDKKKGKNPFAKKTYRTASGGVLEEPDYLAHLAITFADDKAKVASLVKTARRG